MKSIFVFLMTVCLMGSADAQPAPSMPVTAQPMSTATVAMSAPAPVAAMTVAKPATMEAAKSTPVAAVVTVMDAKANVQPVAMGAALATAEVKTEKKWTSEEIAGFIFKILGGLASLVFTILGGLGYMNWAKDKRGEIVRRAFEMAFFAVEALAKNTDNKIDDKLAEFLKRVNSLLTEAGKSKMTSQEESLAKEVAANMAAAEKLNG